ncbi:hypothetical protein ACWJKU_13155 [Methylocaldum sp. MU1018]
MTDFLEQLAAKSMSAEKALQPRLPSLFEPVKAEHGLLPDHDFHLARAEELSTTHATGTDMPSGADAARAPLTERYPQAPSARMGTNLPGVNLDSRRLARRANPREGVSSAQPAHQRTRPSTFVHPAFESEQHNLAISQNPGTDLVRTASGRTPGAAPRGPDEPPYRRQAEPAIEPFLAEPAGSKTKRDAYAIRDENEAMRHYGAVSPGRDQPPNQPHSALRRGLAPVASEASPDTRFQSAPKQTPRAIVARPEVTRSVETPLKAADEFWRDMSIPKSAPTIQVTIGRVEVRATVSAPVPRKAEPGPKAMSLEDYLKQRRGERQ